MMEQRFSVSMGVHQGSALSPYLFNMIMDVLTEEVREEAPYDIVLVDENRRKVKEKLENWREAIEDGGLRISRTKTEYVWFGGDARVGEVSISGEPVTRTGQFKYLTATGDLDREISHRIQSGWTNWKKGTGVLCDRRINHRVKVRIFKSVVRPAMIYVQKDTGKKTTMLRSFREKG